MYKSLIALGLLVAYTTAFPSGAPQGACSTRIPLHGVDSQTSECPYDFVGLGWKQGEFTSMGVFSSDEKSPLQFKGLLASVFHNGLPIGEMRLVDPTQNIPNSASLKLTCDGTSITHGNNEDKSEVFFEWEAPMDLLDTDVVELRLTVVQSQPTFWVDCKKIQLPKITGSSTTSSSSTSTSTTTEAPRRPSTRRTPAPTQRTPAPTQRTPAPTQRTPAPTQRTPAPTQRTPAPTQRPPAPTQRTPASRPRPPPTLAAETEVTESTSASTSSSTSTTTAAPRTRAPIRTTTRTPIRTRPPTTGTTRRTPRTRSPTTTTTRAPIRTRPPPTRAPTKAPTHASSRTWAG